jgi:hypothetical protein
MPKPKTDAPADPDKLIRQEAGSYRTADDRFEAREANGGWFLVDTAHTNEFGQELMQGPMSTLKAVREAIPAARGAKPTPIRPKKSATRPSRKEPPPPPPPPTWIDKLSAAERRDVTRLITELEAEGIADAEALVRRDRDGLMPVVATALIERRLAALVDDAPEVVRRVTEILSSEGTKAKGSLPGWSLVEIGPEPPPTNRRIDLRE